MRHILLLVVFVLLAVSRLSDLADGSLARRYGHVTTFGTVFDLLADLVTHTCVWWLSGLGVAWLLVTLEWWASLGILVTIRRGEVGWKQSLTDSAPGWVRAYFARNQRNLLCAYACLGHFLVPMLVYVDRATPVAIGLTLPGLVVYEAATAYLVFKVCVQSKTNRDTSEQSR